MQTDIEKRHRMNDHRRQSSRASLAGMLEKMTSPVSSQVDLLSLRLSHVDVVERAAGSSGGTSKNVSVEIKQGSLVQIIGRHGEGKSILLRLLSGSLIPAHPKAVRGICIPSHLRVLYVASEAMFFEGSLYDNLTVGVRPGDSDAEMDRVLRICKRFGIPQST